MRPSQHCREPQQSQRWLHPRGTMLMPRAMGNLPGTSSRAALTVRLCPSPPLPYLGDPPCCAQPERLSSAWDVARNSGARRLRVGWQRQGWKRHLLLCQSWWRAWHWGLSRYTAENTPGGQQVPSTCAPRPGLVPRGQHVMSWLHAWHRTPAVFLPGHSAPLSAGSSLGLGRLL